MKRLIYMLYFVAILALLVPAIVDAQHSATVRGRKYHDLNKDGDRDDGEPWLQGWELCLGAECKTTDENGWVVWTGLGTGQAYTLCEELKGGWVNTEPGGTAPYCRTTGVLGPGGDWTLLFGNWKPTVPDTILPDSSITTQGLYPPGSCPTAIEGTATDYGGSGVAEVRLAIWRSSQAQWWNGSSWQPSFPGWVLTADGTESWSYDFSPTIGETYHVWSRAIDAASNWEGWPYGYSSFECTGVTDNTLPDSTVTTSGIYPPGSCPNTIVGTAYDDLSGVKMVEITIQRGTDNKYWNGLAWVDSPVWLLATGTTTWAYLFSPVSNVFYTVQSRATDNAGNVETFYGTNSFVCSTTISVKTLHLRVRDRYDDAFDLGPHYFYFYPTTGLIMLGKVSSKPSTAGLRFSGVNIPQGATITNAVLSVKATGTSSNELHLRVSADDVDNSPNFASSWRRPSSRTKTSAQVDWAPEPWVSGQWHDSPDISAVIQEIVSRPGWVSDNPLTIIIADDGSPLYQNRGFYACDRYFSSAARLTITYMP